MCYLLGAATAIAWWIFSINPDSSNATMVKFIIATATTLGSLIFCFCVPEFAIKVKIEHEDKT